MGRIPPNLFFLFFLFAFFAGGYSYVVETLLKFSKGTRLRPVELDDRNSVKLRVDR